MEADQITRHEEARNPQNDFPLVRNDVLRLLSKHSWVKHLVLVARGKG